MYRAFNLSYSKLFSTKFNRIWDTFIETDTYQVSVEGYRDTYLGIVIHIISLIRNDIQPYDLAMLIYNIYLHVNEC